MAYKNEYSKDTAFNHLLESVCSVVSREIKPDFYIKDADSSSVQFRKAINKLEDAWLLLIVVPKEEYHRYYLENCRLDTTQDYCLIGNLKVMDGEEILSNDSNLYYFNKDTAIQSISESVENIVNASKEFLNNIME